MGIFLPLWGKKIPKPLVFLPLPFREGGQGDRSEQLPHFYRVDCKGGYMPIRVEQDDLISPTRSVLQSIGISGEIVETPGHSDDSISLVMDAGAAFTGDLPSPEITHPENYDQTCASWKKPDRQERALVLSQPYQPDPR